MSPSITDSIAPSNAAASHLSGASASFRVVDQGDVGDIAPAPGCRSPGCRLTAIASGVSRGNSAGPDHQRVPHRRRRHASCSQIRASNARIVRGGGNQAGSDECATESSAAFSGSVVANEDQVFRFPPILSSALNPRWSPCSASSTINTRYRDWTGASLRSRSSQVSSRAVAASGSTSTGALGANETGIHRPARVGGRPAHSSLMRGIR